MMNINSRWKCIGTISSLVYLQQVLLWDPVCSISLWLPAYASWRYLCPKLRGYIASRWVLLLSLAMNYDQWSMGFKNTNRRWGQLNSHNRWIPIIAIWPWNILWWVSNLNTWQCARSCFGKSFTTHLYILMRARLCIDRVLVFTVWFPNFDW